MRKISSSERREREIAKMREEILKAAREIMTAEGPESISVRKIADRIEYSPAIIYHYFKNKDEILEKLMEADYKRIVEAVAAANTGSSPREGLRECLTRYLNLAVEMGEFYKGMMLSGSPAVLSRTSVLHRGASAERPAIGMLCGSLRGFPALAGCAEEELEAAAQVVWSTAFGLALRMIVEKVESGQRQRLTEEAARLILNSLESPKTDYEGKE